MSTNLSIPPVVVKTIPESSYEVWAVNEDTIHNILELLPVKKYELTTFGVKRKNTLEPVDLGFAMRIDFKIWLNDKYLETLPTYSPFESMLTGSFYTTNIYKYRDFYTTHELEHWGKV